MPGDVTRLVDPTDLGGVWLEGTLATPRPVGAIVRGPDGNLYASTDAVLASYVRVSNAGPEAVVVAASPVAVTVGPGTQILLVDTVPCDITFGAIEANQGIVIVKDRTGLASPSNPITITPTGAETIDSEGTFVIDGPYAAVQFYGEGTEWSAL